MDNSVTDTIAQTARQYGIDPSFALAVASRESEFDPTAHASKTIYGLFQMSKPLRDQYGIGNSTDPAVQTAGWARFMADTKGRMAQILGREPTDGEAYLGHYWGAGRAAHMIANGGNVAPSDVFTPQELAANPNLAKNDTVAGDMSKITADISQREAKYGGSGVAQNAPSSDFSAFGQPQNVDLKVNDTSNAAPNFAKFGTAEGAASPTNNGGRAADAFDFSLLGKVAGSADSAPPSDEGGGGTSVDSAPPPPQLPQAQQYGYEIPVTQLFPVQGIPALPGAKLQQPQQQATQQQPPSSQTTMLASA